MGRNVAEGDKKERPPVSELTVGLWVLAIMLAFVLFVLWYFGHMYGGS